MHFLHRVFSQRVTSRRQTPLPGRRCTAEDRHLCKTLLFSCLDTLIRCFIATFLQKYQANTVDCLSSDSNHSNKTRKG